jgi:hypothetical protein
MKSVTSLHLDPQAGCGSSVDERATGPDTAIAIDGETHRAATPMSANTALPLRVAITANGENTYSSNKRARRSTVRGAPSNVRLEQRALIAATHSVHDLADSQRPPERSPSADRRARTYLPAAT